MAVNHSHRPAADLVPEPKIGRLALISLILHLLLVVLFSGALIPQPTREHRPVYFVDLSQMPVANPQAGRPDGAKVPSPKPGPASPAPVKPAPPKPAPVKPAPPKPAPVQKAAAPKAVKTAQKDVKPTVSKAPSAKPTSTTTSTKTADPKAKAEKEYQETLKAMQALKEKAARQQEMDALKDKIAALGAMDTRNGSGSGTGSGSDAPLGTLDGTGDEVGVSQEMWLRAWFKKNWTFSKYQASRRDLEALAKISYDAKGTLLGYEFKKKSGDGNFDDSVTKAILKGRQLPFQPGRRLDVDVIFNLKDLMD